MRPGVGLLKAKNLVILAQCQQMDLGFNHKLLSPYDFNSEEKILDIGHPVTLYIELDSPDPEIRPQVLRKSPIWLTVRIISECF